tara:strand:- start:8 stop:1300 length:1293 start_codon:yes stop_codon:yes gene_type:complete
MPVSPQDFDLYSRMTGAQIPSDPLSRMQMAPEVYKFTKEFARKPNIFEQGGNLIKNIGKTVGMGMAGAAASPAFVEDKPAEPVTVDQTPTRPKITSGYYDQRDVENQNAGNLIAEVTDRGAELADSETIAEKLAESEESMPALPGTEPIGLLESQKDRFRRRAITEEADEFVAGMDPLLLAAIKQSRDPQPLEGFKGRLPNYLGDHPDLKGGEVPNSSLNTNYTETTPETPITPQGTDTNATVNLTGQMRNVLDSLAKGRADLSPEERINLAKKLVSPNELAGKDQKTFEALKTGIPLGEQKAAAERVKQKTEQKQRELGISNTSTPSTPSIGSKVEAFKNKFMPNKPSSYIESMSLETSPNKPLSATFNLYQKDGSTKPYTYGISSPMAVSLNEMAKDESLTEESFGQIMNLLKKSQKDGTGMGFSVDQ